MLPVYSLSSIASPSTEPFIKPFHLVQTIFECERKPWSDNNRPAFVTLLSFVINSNDK